jgi:hypothetical protein
MLCLAWNTSSWCWYRCPEIGTSSVDWVQLSRFYLKTETESSLRNVVFWKISRTVFLDKDRTMDNVQQHNICAKMPEHKIVSFFLCDCKTWSHYQGRTDIDDALELDVKKHFWSARDKLTEKEGLYDLCCISSVIGTNMSYSKLLVLLGTLS